MAPRQPFDDKLVNVSASDDETTAIGRDIRGSSAQ
jgi:hypothetical protein